MAGKNETSVGVKFTADASGFERVVKGMINSTGMLKGALGATGMNQLLELGKKGWEGYKKVMESTEGSAEKLDQQLAILDGTMTGFVRTVASQGLIAGLGDYARNMITAAEATRELTAAQQEHEHAAAGRTITRGYLQLGLQESRTSAAETTDPAEKAGFIQEAINYRKELTALDVTEIAQRLKIDEEYYKTLTGHSKEYFDYFMEQVPKLAQEYEKYFGKNSVQLEGAKIRLDQLKYAAMVNPLTAEQESERHQLQLLIYVLEDYVQIQDDFSKKGQWDNFIKGIGEMGLVSAEGEKALVRLLNQLTTLKKKLGDSEFGKESGFTASTSYISNPRRILAGMIGGRSGKNQLAGAPGEITEIATQAGIAQDAIKSLEGGFQSMILNAKEGFSSLLDSFANMIAGMLAKAAVAGLLNIIAPGSGMATAALTSFRSYVGVPGYANGTNFAPGGLSLVGENGPELVNLPRGSKVTPMRDGKISLYSQISNRSIIMTGTVYNKRLFDNT